MISFMSIFVVSVVQLPSKSFLTLNLERIVSYKENDIPMLRENFQITVNEREEMEQSLLKQASEEFDRIRESLDEEMRAREEGEEEIANFIREVTHNCQEQIMQEKREREKMEESLLVLLEETCTRLSASANM